MAIVKVNWSGGKDSTCALWMHLQQGDTVKAVCYIPMLTDDIPLIMPEHYEFIHKTADRFRAMGAEVHIVSGMTYKDFVLRIRTKGNFPGEIVGFPCFVTGRCNFKNYSKIPALKKCDVGNYDYTDIGIAFGETKRYGQLNDKKRSILKEREVTEQEAFIVCGVNDLLSPHYFSDVRDGCALCSNKNRRFRNAYFAAYPEAKQVVWELQEAVKASELPLRIKYPLRNHEWFLYENDMEGI